MVALVGCDHGPSLGGGGGEGVVHLVAVSDSPGMVLHCLVCCYCAFLLSAPTTDSLLDCTLVVCLLLCTDVVMSQTSTSGGHCALVVASTLSHTS